ncbi:hypothetical protein G8770_03500 [Aestuariicella hydrocarbonica]|uniref:Uncharacterized protein n=1 Tax=Pseudomaricurvus hydrocarbonicus TaxID=1470433 RepID=A0A9E5MLT6_9GAMM|nr:hypothetical protein [Aestuariicella hydrocarbonica]NHO64610.1 hypothetical protein [Aestuariicella hydrocarbonica]
MIKANGCGPGWLPRWLKAMLFDWFFEASCNKHDEGYEQGGDEIRRFECDWKFFQAMRRDTLRFRGLARLIRWCQALFYFAMVRMFGWIQFNYTKDGQN